MGWDAHSQSTKSKDTHGRYLEAPPHVEALQYEDGNDGQGEITGHVEGYTHPVQNGHGLGRVLAPTRRRAANEIGNEAARRRYHNDEHHRPQRPGDGRSGAAPVDAKEGAADAGLDEAHGQDVGDVEIILNLLVWGGGGERSQVSAR